MTEKKKREFEFFISQKETHFYGSNSRNRFYSKKQDQSVLETLKKSTSKHLYVSPRFQNTSTKKPTKFINTLNKK